jgi:hypothetical protein
MCLMHSPIKTNMKGLIGTVVNTVDASYCGHLSWSLLPNETIISDHIKEVQHGFNCSFYYNVVKTSFYE